MLYFSTRLRVSGTISLILVLDCVTTASCQCPSGGKRRGRSGGAWLSSSSSFRASLFLFSYTPDSPLALLIDLNGKIHEEHFISNLHLTWPQISSDTVKGSRVVLASYKDSFGQTQKFAMRFLDCSQSELFIDSLKDIMKNVGTVGFPSSNYLYDVPSGNEYVHSNDVHYSAVTKSNPAHTAGNDTLLIQPSVGHAAECAFIVETSATEGNTGTTYFQSFLPQGETQDRKLLPSVSVFVDNICNRNHQGATKPAKVPLEADVFSDLVKDLPGAVFNAMLNELESFIHEQEGNLAVKV